MYLCATRCFASLACGVALIEWILQAFAVVWLFRAIAGRKRSREHFRTGARADMTKMSTVDEASASTSGDSDELQWRFSQIKGNLDVEENPTDGECLGGVRGRERRAEREIRSAPLIRLRQYWTN